MKTLTISLAICLFQGRLLAHAGSTTHLSELDLSRMTSGWRTPQRNAAASGEALTVAGVTYTNGIGTPALSSWTLKLDGNAQQFTARVGIQKQPPNTIGSAEFVVRGDGIELNCYMVAHYRALAYMAGPLMRNDDRQHWLAEAETLAQRINERMWDDALGFYVDVDRKTGKRIPVMTPAGFMPLFIHIAPRERAERLAKHAAGPAPAQTIIVHSPDASTNERLAAKEIRRYVYLRTGRLLPVASDLSDQPDRLILARDGSLAPEEFRIEPGRISGGSDIGVLYGAYRYIEHLGVRFYLHGDVVPDERLWELPAVHDAGKPLFARRGILPFHDFPVGPDLWEADDYKAVLAQMVKLRMNFIGLHTYTETGWGSEPTVWLGLPEDMDERGRPRFSYAAHYFSTARNASGHVPRKVEEMLFGASQMFAPEPFGPSVMHGMMPQPKTLEEKNELFARSGNLLNDAFTYARRFGVKTCVGTEIPLTHPTRLLPHELRAHLEAQGKSVHDPEVHKALYRGAFLRAMKTYPLDYYWLWTPEAWRLPQPDAVVRATQDDLLAAVAAAKEVNAPFTLATAGWTLGPSKDRTLFDCILPKEMPFSCINLELGTVPVDAGFAKLKGRPGWAIPWLEDDLSMTSPQLWVGRILRDAHDAKKYGCEGLMGIHWRTAEVSPMVGALAQAQWRAPQAPAHDNADTPVVVRGGNAAGFHFPAPSPVYHTVRWDVDGYDLTLPDGSYCVTLQFVEPAYDAPGKRVFGVALQGRTVADQLDVFASVGRNKPLDLHFDDIAVTDGRLRIGFLKDIADQLIGADREEALGRYADYPCIAGIVVEGAGRTLKVNCGGPAWNDYLADPGPPSVPRHFPADDFYLDWARHNFGREAAAGIAALFTRLDGRLPTPAPICPGGITVNPAPWDAVKPQYAFVDELAALRPQVRGAGNLARFDNWVKSFAYLRAIGRAGCARGALDRAMSRRDREEALRARIELNGAWREMMTWCIETANTWGGIGSVLTHEMFNRANNGFLEGHDRALGELPPEARPDHTYHGAPRLIVPTARGVVDKGETLKLRIIVLGASRPTVHIRPLGEGAWQQMPAAHLDRAVYEAELPAARDDFEYYITAGDNLIWPATAPEMSQTVVVMEQNPTTRNRP